MNKITLVAVESEDCDGCVFQGWECAAPSFASCAAYERDDKRSIIWVLETPDSTNTDN